MTARLIAARSRGVSIDTDLLVSPLRDAAMGILGLEPADVDGHLYRTELRPAVYQCLANTAIHLASQIHLVIADAPFHPETANTEYWDSFTANATKCDVALVRVHLVAHPEVVRARMLQRNEARDRGKLANWDEFQKHWSITAPTGVQLVNTSNASPETIAGIVQEILESSR